MERKKGKKRERVEITNHSRKIKNNNPMGREQREERTKERMEGQINNEHSYCSQYYYSYYCYSHTYGKSGKRAPPRNSNSKHQFFLKILKYWNKFCGKEEERRGREGEEHLKRKKRERESR